MNKSNSTAAAGQKSDFKNVAKNFVSLSDILSNKTSTLSRTDSLRSNKLREDKKTEAPSTVRSGQTAQQSELVKQQQHQPTPPLFFDFLTVQALFKELELDCDEQIKKLDENEKSRKQIAFEQKKIVDEIRLRWVQSPDTFKLAKPVRSTSCSCFSRTRRGDTRVKRRHRQRRSAVVRSERKLFKFKNSKLSVQNHKQFVAKRCRSRKLLLRLRPRSLVVYVKYGRKFSPTVFLSRFVKVSWSRRIDGKHLDALTHSKSLDRLRFEGPRVQLRTKKSLKKRPRPSTRMLISQLPKITMNSEPSTVQSNDSQTNSKTLLDKLYAKYCDQSESFKEPPALKIVQNGDSEFPSSVSPPPCSSTLLIRRKTKKYNNGNLTMPLMSALSSDTSSNVSGHRLLPLRSYQPQHSVNQSREMALT